MTINVIVAVSDNGVIGKDGKIPWKLSTDLARFKEITMGHTVIMGRKTFESIGEPLPDRANVVISQSLIDKEYAIHGGFHDAPRYKALGNGLIYTNRFHMGLALRGEDVFIIGGQQIYDEIFKTPELIHRVYLTRVHCNVEGDTFFKHAFPSNKYGTCVSNARDVWWEQDDGSMVKWKLISEEFVPRRNKDEYGSTFQIWENRS